MDDALLRPQPTELAVVGETPPERRAVGDELLQLAPDEQGREQLDGGATQIVAATHGERHADALVRPVGGEEHVGARVVGILVDGIGAGERDRRRRPDIEGAGTGDAGHRESMLEGARWQQHVGATAMPERVIVVTGSSGGIGSAIVDRFTRVRRHRRRARPASTASTCPGPDDCAAAAARIIAEHRPHRRALQQRRYRRHGRRRRVFPRRLATGLRGQRVRRRQHVARRAPRDARRGPRCDRKHVFGRRVGRPGRPRGVLGVEGRGARADPRDGGRRDRATAYASTASRPARSRARGSNERSPPSPIPRPASRRSAGGNRSAAWSRARRSRRRSCISPTTRRSRPAPTSCSTAASPACASSTDAGRVVTLASPRRRADVRPAVRHVHTGRGRGRRARRSPDAQPAGGRHARGRRANRRARDAFQVRAVAGAVVAPARRSRRRHHHRGARTASGRAVSLRRRAALPAPVDRRTRAVGPCRPRRDRARHLGRAARLRHHFRVPGPGIGLVRHASSSSWSDAAARCSTAQLRPTMATPDAEHAIEICAASPRAPGRPRRLALRRGRRRAARRPRRRGRRVARRVGCDPRVGARRPARTASLSGRSRPAGLVRGLPRVGHPAHVRRPRRRADVPPPVARRARCRRSTRRAEACARTAARSPRSSRRATSTVAGSRSRAARSTTP